MNNPLISIIVPIYRVEKYVSECITSIINQTYSNFELIAVDDGSPDKSCDIVESIIKLDSRCRLLHKSNGGLSDARNYGIRFAKGEYVTFIDSDDYIDKTYLEELIRAADNNMDIICCSHRIVSEDSKIIEEISENKKQVITLNKFDAMRELISERRVHTVAWGKLYKMQLFNKIQFPVGRIHEDVYVMHLLFDKANGVCVIDSVLYNYRINNNSITKRRFYSSRQDVVYAELERLDFVKNKYPQFEKEQIKMVVWHCCNNNYEILRSDKKFKDEFKFNNKLIYENFSFFISSDASIKAKVMACISIILEKIYCL